MKNEMIRELTTTEIDKVSAGTSFNLGDVLRNGIDITVDLSGTRFGKILAFLQNAVSQLTASSPRPSSSFKSCLNDRDIKEGALRVDGLVPDGGSIQTFIVTTTKNNTELTKLPTVVVVYAFQATRLDIQIRSRSSQLI